MLYVDVLRGAGLSAICEVTLKVSRAVLMGVDLTFTRLDIHSEKQETRRYLLAIKCAELCRHNLQEVLEHVLGLARASNRAVQRVIDA